MGNQKDQAICAKKIVVIITFAAIIFLPAVLGMVESFWEKKVDVDLRGYTDSVAKPSLTAESFFAGDFQGEFTSWFDANLKPRGVFTKTYATIRYNLFNLGNKIIGKNRDIFEFGYIEKGLVTNEAFDMSLPGNREKMEEYIRKLELLQEKLAQHGKYLYVYMPSTKVDFNYDNVPNKYKDIAREGAINSGEYFDELMQTTTIPYLNCEAIGKNLEYPQYYTTGIHWSRPYEQTVSQKIVADISALTGKNYRQILFGPMKQSDKPFWRDADVYDLLNIWWESNVTYYEYTTQRDFPMKYDKKGILLHGTSFALGLRKDVLELYPSDDLYYVNRSGYLYTPQNELITFNGDWNSTKIADYLNCIDVVVIEHVSSEISMYSYGFVDYLLQVLENYEPQMPAVSTMKLYDGSLDTAPDQQFISGFYWKEIGFCWVKPESEVQLQDAEIAQKGLQVEFSIPSSQFINSEKQEVYIYVNGNRVFEREYNAEISEKVIIPAETMALLREDGDVYTISVHCSNSFNLHEMGLSDDSRELALRMEYIGRAK